MSVFIAAATDFVVRTRLESGKAMLLGLELLLPSLALLVLSQAAHSMFLLLAGTVFGGIATAFAYFGSLQVVNQIAPDGQRSEVVSTYIIFCYLGNSVPVIGIGLLAGITTSMTAHVVFVIMVALLAVVGLITGVKYAPQRRPQHAARPVEARRRKAS